MKSKKNNINEKLKGKTIDELLDLVILGLENTNEALLTKESCKKINKIALKKCDYNEMFFNNRKNKI